MREDLVKWFQAHPEVSIIGFFVGLILGIWSIIIGIKSKRKQALSYSFNGYNLIRDFSEKISGLTVSFNNDKVKNFTITKIAIWNSGNSTLNGLDIVNGDYLRIEADEDVVILNCEILQSNEPSNSFHIDREEEKTPHSLRIAFDYIDPNQGCVIQVFHNGKSSDQLSLKGKIKGIDKLSKVDHSKLIYRVGQLMPMTKNLRINRIILGCLLLLFSIIVCIIPILKASIDKNRNPADKYFFWVVIMPYAYTGFKLLINKLPKGLTTFDERLM